MKILIVGITKNLLKLASFFRIDKDVDLEVNDGNSNCRDCRISKEIQSFNVIISAKKEKKLKIGNNWNGREVDGNN